MTSNLRFFYKEKYVKHLAVLIEKNLSWRQHIDLVALKLVKR